MGHPPQHSPKNFGLKPCRLRVDAGVLVPFFQVLWAHVAAL